MGKGGKPQVEVTQYYMSQHFGICATVDSIQAIYVKEKEIWSGTQETIGIIPIDLPEHFGGPKKEGGVEGNIHYLPGDDAQIMPDLLAQKLGRAGGSDCPAFRGISSIFCYGQEQPGFYWAANNPYLPGVWVKVQRAPRAPATSGSVVIDFQNETYSINGVSKTLSEVVTHDSGPFTPGALVPGEGWVCENDNEVNPIFSSFGLTSEAVDAVLGPGLPITIAMSFNLFSEDEQAIVTLYVDDASFDNNWTFYPWLENPAVPPFIEIFHPGGTETDPMAADLVNGEYSASVVMSSGAFSVSIADFDSAEIASPPALTPASLGFDVTATGGTIGIPGISRATMRKIEITQGGA